MVCENRPNSNCIGAAIVDDPVETCQFKTVFSGSKRSDENGSGGRRFRDMPTVRLTDSFTVVGNGSPKYRSPIIKRRPADI